MMTGLDLDARAPGLEVLGSQPRGRRGLCACLPIRRAQRLGEVVRIILSYTDYVNRVVCTGHSMTSVGAELSTALHRPLHEAAPDPSGVGQAERA